LKIQCVIYDCDGVLFDSLEANRTLYDGLAASLGRPALNDEELTYVHSHTVFEAVHFMFGRVDGLEEKALEALKQVDFREYIKYLTMEPHLFETLSRLKQAGIFRAISTNRTTSMPHVVERFNLRPYFDIVVTALDVRNPKPHPESVEKIAEALKLDKSAVLFVGDSEVDRKTAESAGVKFIAYKNRDLAGYAYIDDHIKILDLIRETDRLHEPERAG
jgi:phosphoglycolate phosphatase